MKKLLPLFCIFFFPFSLFAQTYISQKQAISPYSGDDVFTEGQRVVILNQNDFSIELPDQPILEGTFKRETVKGKEILKINGGGLIQVTEDQIWVNLFGTDLKAGYTFFLESYVEPTEKEKAKQKENVKKIVEEKMYQTYLEGYGKLTADGIRDSVVKIGMHEIGVLLVLGKPTTINETEDSSGISKQFVYENQYIYLKNGKVTAIQTSY